MHEEPREFQDKQNEFYLKAITEEKELTAEEADQIKRNHNQSFFDELKANSQQT